ncbi:transglycosylase family protein [Streptomyces sp. NPDC018693]|uniref:transglycosylase family protein n=1 Tax=unclassified Streptomyces TaxID=2593676 RepID=UPI0037BE1E85
MLSGNGRHRRPRQAPALLVAAGVTGSAIAIPLLGASGASAADGTVWDKVAECETGGSWSADEGNGEYGGLSLTQDDWEAYGGLDYAPSADQASRKQQIAVAQKLLAEKGVGAWGTCGLTAGLTKANGTVAVDTGLPQGALTGTGLSDSSKSSTGGTSSSSGSSSPSDSSGSSSSSGSSAVSTSPSVGPSTGASAETSTDSSPSTPSSGTTDSSAKSDTSAPADPGVEGAQAADGSPTVTADGEKSDNSGQSVGSWSLVDTGALGTGRHRGAPAEESAGSGESASDAYVVRDGDTLASIADSLDVTGGWRGLYDGNKDVIGPDPSHIVPGQTLSVGSE